MNDAILCGGSELLCVFRARCSIVRVAFDNPPESLLESVRSPSNARPFFKSLNSLSETQIVTL